MIDRPRPISSACLLLPSKRTQADRSIIQWMQSPSFRSVDDEPAVNSSFPLPVLQSPPHILIMFVCSLLLLPYSLTPILHSHFPRPLPYERSSKHTVHAARRRGLRRSSRTDFCVARPTSPAAPWLPRRETDLIFIFSLPSGVRSVRHFSLPCATTVQSKRLWQNPTARRACGIARSSLPLAD